MVSSTDVRNKNSLNGALLNNIAEDREYLKEYIHILLLGITFCVFVSIITYNPADPSSFNLNSNSINNISHVSNTFGFLGASIADWSFQVCGLGAMVFSMVFIIQLLNTFRRPRQRSRFGLRVFGYPQLILCYLGLMSLISPEIRFR